MLKERRCIRGIHNLTQKIIIVLFLGMGILSLSACNASDLAKVGDPAPGFTLKSAAGDEVSISDFINSQPVLLYFHMAKG